MASSSSSAAVRIRCKGILFDMDGILVSSLESVERSWSKWAEMREVDPEVARKTAHGCRAIDTIAKLRPDLNPESELKVIEDIEVDDNEGLAVLPGVLELLAALPRDRWTVVTSATERLAVARLNAGGIPAPRCWGSCLRSAWSSRIQLQARRQAARLDARWWRRPFRIRLNRLMRRIIWSRISPA